MTGSVDRRLLDRLDQSGPMTAARCRNAVHALGELAPWWLEDSVLLKAMIADPDVRKDTKLPQGEGQVNLLLVRPGARGISLLRDTVVLPVRWTASTATDSRLPLPLVKLSEAILDQLHEDPAVKTSSWQLHMGVNVDLSQLTADDFRTASAWAPLAAGLLLAARRLTPEPAVWATGAWDQRGGVAAIEGLDAKLAAAAALGARVIFVPAANAPEARTWCSSHAPHLKLHFLPADATEPQRALEPYLSIMGHPPPLPRDESDEDMHRCVTYYQLLPNRDERRTDFYFSHLMSTLVTRHRQDVHVRWPGCRPEHLVTVVSESPEMVTLNAQVTGARRCLLLCSKPGTRTMMPFLHRIMEHLKAQGVECVPGWFDLGTHQSLLHQFDTLTARFLPVGVDPKAVVYDLTPGKKPMTLALAQLARPGQWLLYLDHVFSPERRAEAGTEAFELWQAG